MLATLLTISCSLVTWEGGLPLPRLIGPRPPPHFWDVEAINLMALLSLCVCIEPVPSIKMTLGVSFPQSGSSDAKGAPCPPCVGGWCLLTQQVTICIFFISYTSYGPPTHCLPCLLFSLSQHLTTEEIRTYILMDQLITDSPSWRMALSSPGSPYFFLGVFGPAPSTQ